MQDHGCTYRCIEVAEEGVRVTTCEVPGVGTYLYVERPPHMDDILVMPPKWRERQPREQFHEKSSGAL